MPLQVRRGTEAQRQAMTVPLADGELLVADGKLYVGNGTTLGGIGVTAYTDQQSRDAAAGLFTSAVHTGISFTYDQTLGTLSAVVDLSDYDGVLKANAFNGSLVADDSSLLVDATDGSINLDGTVKGHIVPSENITYDLGSLGRRFRDLYLSGSSIHLGSAIITSTGLSVNLPAGTTVGGNAILTPGALLEGTLYGSVVTQDSLLIIDGETSTVNLDGTVRGAIIPDEFEVYDIGDSLHPFKTVYAREIQLGAANIAAVGSAINLPAGSTVDGVPIGSGGGGGGLANVVEDTTPQLGGSLDLNTNDINGTGNINITGNITASGTFTGRFDGDLNGSIFADNSTLLVDATGGRFFGDLTGDVTGSVLSTDQSTTIIDADNITLSTPTLLIENEFIRSRVDQPVKIWSDGPSQAQVVFPTIAAATTGPGYGLASAGSSWKTIEIMAYKGTVDSPSGDMALGDVVGAIKFAGFNTSTNYDEGSFIGVQIDPSGTPTTSHSPTKMFFINQGRTSSNPPVLMVFDSAGQLGINQETASATLDVNGFAKLAVLTAEPASPADGMIAIANGSSWNPLGNGKQSMVVRLGGTWREIAAAL